jgi:hypothetical protein
MAESIFDRGTTQDVNVRYPAIAQALAPLPYETVIDGELVAPDASARPSFKTLQNHGASDAPIIYHGVFFADPRWPERDDQATCGETRLAPSHPAEAR